MADTKIIDESHKISDTRDNGKLRREIWVASVTGKVTRYNLAYINQVAGNSGPGRQSVRTGSWQNSKPISMPSKTSCNPTSS